jgi:uncharacterized DUF497 family protein
VHLVGFVAQELRSKSDAEKISVPFVSEVVLDVKHSQDEDRYYCIAMVNQRIMIVRFVLRNGKIRIIGAGYWRNGVKFYEKKEI